MALYREGKAAMAADGTVTGTGTKWQSSLSLIRPGATIMFLSSPIQMAVVNKVVSDTEIKAITTKGAVVASSDYAILLSDSLTVDGLAQDVAETLRYYQSQETVIADAVEFFKDFDFEALQNLANQIKADSEAAESSAAAAAASENAAKTSETNSKASEVAAETARDQVQQIINDAGEQSTLVALAQPDGASNIGGIGFVSPEMFGYLHGVSPDAVPYYQKAVDEGHARGLPVKLTGKYYATTYPHKVTLPGDDGTAYPGWVAAGNDANIAAEPENHIYAAIRIYPDSVVIGDSMQNCALIGDWDSDTPVINNNQHIGYFISGDSSDGYLRPQLVNHGVRNFFIGRYGNGVLDRSIEDNFLIRDCCLTGWFMGADSVCNGFVVARDCFAGDAYGGAWTQRNAAITIPYLPPYPAAEIFKVGWVDAIRYTKYHFYGKTRLFGPADEAIDTWFDTYIYKSANSARTSAGGRLTNNTASGYSARSFPGIAGRAFTVLSRYGRSVNGVCLDDVKVLGTHRVPFYTDAGSYNVIHTSYVEKTCLVDTTTTTIAGNQFYTDYQDPWNPSLTKAPAMVCQGSIVVDRVVVSAGVATNPFSEAVNELSGPRRLRMFRQDESDYNLFELSEWNAGANKVNYWYSFDRMSSVQRPIYFYNRSQEKFEYYAGEWTPVVKCGSDPVTLTTAVGTYRKIGRLIFATFRIETNSMALTTGGAVVISGLPFTVAALSDGGFSLTPVVCSRAANATTTILAQTKPGSKDLALVTGSTLATFGITSGTDLTIYGSIQYVISN